MSGLLKWNDALAERYLVEGEGTEEALMCATWGDIYEIGHRWNLDQGESRSDFLKAILQGPQGDDWDELIDRGRFVRWESGRWRDPKNPRMHPFQIAAMLSDDRWRGIRPDGSFPPYIAYMVLCVIAASSGDKLPLHNYWDRMWGVLEEVGYQDISAHREGGGRPKGIDIMSGRFISPWIRGANHPMSPSRARMWVSLNEWCEDNGYLRFYTRRGGSYTPSYVERYFQHALLASEDLSDTLPRLFHREMAILGDNPPPNRLSSLIHDQRVDTFSRRFEKTKDDGTDEHRKALISQVRLCHQRWVAKGCRAPIDPGAIEPGARTATVILQIDSPYGDNFDDGFNLLARVRVTGDPSFDSLEFEMGGNLKLEGVREVTQQNGAHLSTRLRRDDMPYSVENLRWESGFGFTGHLDGVEAQFSGRRGQMRIFIRSSDRRLGLPGGGWTEWTGDPRPGEAILLLCHRSMWDEVLRWVGNFMEYDQVFEPDELAGFDGWGVLKGTRKEIYTEAQGGISGEMALSRTARVQSIGHIRNGAKGRLSYFSFGAPMVRVSGIDNPVVTIDGEDVDEEGGAYLLHPGVVDGGKKRVRITDAGYHVKHSYKRIRITDSRVHFDSKTILRDQMGTPVDSSPVRFSGAVIRTDDNYTPPNFVQIDVLSVTDTVEVGVDVLRRNHRMKLVRRERRQPPWGQCGCGGITVAGKFGDRELEECFRPGGASCKRRRKRRRMGY